MESSINTASLVHAGELEGTSGADQLTGSSGDDTLLGFEGDDTLSGGEGNDQLFGDNGNNVLAGGRGDDLLVGGDDADVYLFGLGDGHDVIQDNALAQVDDSKAHDELRFGTGIAPVDLEILRVGDDLVFQHVNDEDSVTIDKWFVNERYWVERITFADGTAWGVNDLAARVIVATGSERRETLTGWIGKDHLMGLGGNDTLKGMAGDDLLEGGAGNDTLLGGQGDDQLEGGDGDDLLDGGAGDDILIGGRGNDTLMGGEGHDVYRIEPGAGHAVLVFSAEGEGNIQVIELGQGLSPEHICVEHRGDDLVLTHNPYQMQSYGDSDALVSVRDWFSNPAVRTEQIRFADGTVWTVEDLAGRVIEGRGWGQEQGDSLTGWEGRDHLQGGAGNDILNGGNGDDSYRFRLGDGQDRIQDSQGNDTLLLENIAADKLWFQRSDKDLRISVQGGADSITVSNWFAGAANQIETLVAGDGKRLLSSQVQALVDAMAAFNPPASGATSGQPGEQGELATLVSSSWK
ncbi:calcium-binding protein [Aeromonas diversa]|uniref:calcium-binding protein n=1 Tax=Aeromonas diversa TaxID=502790 RepID=UPI0039A336EF